MSARIATTSTAIAGVIRVTVPGGDDAAGRKLARSAAQKAHGFGSVGKTPQARKHGRSTVWDFTPVTVTPAAPAPASPRKREAGPSVETLQTAIADLQAQLAALTSVTAKPSPKAPREVPAFIREAGARKAAITCKCCRDLGVVRGVGANAGGAYKTADGAAAAKAAGRAVPCPSHKRAARTA